MAKIAKKTKRYPSDLTDEEWSGVEPFLPKTAAVGSPRRIHLREVLNAIRYLVRSGCDWRMLPIHFPPWQTVYWWFRRLARRLMFRTIHDIALMIDRARSGSAPEPTAAVIDSQSVKAPAPGARRGFDGAKKIVGRKRHIAVLDRHRCREFLDQDVDEGLTRAGSLAPPTNMHSISFTLPGLLVSSSWMRQPAAVGSTTQKAVSRHWTKPLSR